jgi:uncharacterized membrane protein YdjX (TVP38/TMEM64 family)
VAVAVHRRAARRRLLLLAAAVGAAFACAVAFLPHDPARLRELAEALAPVLVAGVLLAWTLLTPALVSGTLLAIATGLLLDVLAGATLGATAAFLVARRLGRAPAAVLAGPRLERLRERVEARPFLTILLARLAPGSPAALLRYAAGLTHIRLRHFCAAMAIGGAPRVLLYTALGRAAADGALVPAVTALALIAVLSVGGALLVRRRR